MRFSSFGSARQKSFAGIDLGSFSVKFAVVTPLGGTRYRLADCREIEFLETIPPKDLAKNALHISEVLRSVKSFIGASCVVAVSLPSDLVLIKRLKLPHIPRSEIIASLHLEVNRHLQSHLDRLVIDYEVQKHNKSDSTLELLFAAARKETIEEYLSIVETSGLTVSVVDVDVLALHNVFFHSYPQELERLTAILDIGHRKTTVIISKGHSLLQTRHLSFGGSVYRDYLLNKISLGVGESNRTILDFHSKVFAKSRLRPHLDTVSEYGTSRIGQMLSEIRKELGTKAFDNLHICGGASLIPGLKESLVRLLEVPIPGLNPFRKLDAQCGDLNESAAVFAVAIGSALRVAES